MYEKYLACILEYVRALNAASSLNEKTNNNDGLTPYVQNVPVILDDELCGFLNDEFVGEYMYEESTPQDKEWWEKRPWAMRNRAARDLAEVEKAIRP